MNDRNRAYHLPLFNAVLGAVIGLIPVAAVAQHEMPMQGAPSVVPTVEASPTATPVPTLEHLLPPNFESRIRIAYEGKLSGRIAFTITVDEQDRIMVLDLDGRKIRRLVDWTGSHSFPSWSPTGGELAFSSDQDGGQNIYVVDWIGQNQRQITKGPRLNEHPNWSHDGKSIYFTSTDDAKGVANIFAVDPKGTLAKPVTRFDGRNMVPKLSPDDRIIAYSTNRNWPGWDVCELHLLTGKETCILSGTESYCRADWSPDGLTMAYTFGQFEALNVGLLDRVRGSRRGVTKLEGKEYDVAFSPDGAFLVFAAEGELKGTYNLHLMSLTDGRVQRLLDAPFVMRYPAWSKVTTLELESARIREMQRALADAQATATAIALQEAATPSMDSESMDGEPASETPTPQIPAH